MENFVRVDMRLNAKHMQAVYSLMEAEKKKKSDVIRELLSLGLATKKQQKSGNLTLSVKDEVMIGLLLKINGMLYQSMKKLLSDSENNCSIDEIEEMINSKLAKSIDQVEQGQVRYKNLKI